MIHGTLESAMGRKQFLRDIILALSKVTMPGGMGGTHENIALMGTYPCILQLQKKKTSRQAHNT